MMKIMNYDVIVLGGGPAGMAAALAAAKQADRVLIIERNQMLGGILNQCIHDGFGSVRYKELLTGPEYAGRFANMVGKTGNITVLQQALVTEVSTDRKVYCSTRGGLYCCQAKAIVLATGCRERTRGAIAIAGTRPSGIYTAGVAQQLINMENISIGKKAVILGSGDIGLIMARRLTLEGIEVVCVFEKMPYCSGLPRNVHQCLIDYNIPLYLSRTVTEICGEKRLERVIASDIDALGNVVPGSEYAVDCDTLILSVGLIPENEIAKQFGIQFSPITKGAVVTSHLETNIPGVFACGNALHVNDLVDNVSDEGELAGAWAARYAGGERQTVHEIPVRCGENVRYIVPQTLLAGEPTVLSLRVAQPHKEKTLYVSAGKEIIVKQRFTHVSPAEMIRVKIPNIGAEVEELEVYMK